MGCGGERAGGVYDGAVCMYASVVNLIRKFLHCIKNQRCNFNWIGSDNLQLFSDLLCPGKAYYKPFNILKAVQI